MKPEIRSALAWVSLLGPPTVWFVHLGIVYAAASIGIVASGAAGMPSRIAIGAVTLLALLAIAGLAWIAPRWSPDQEPAKGFWPPLVRILAIVSAIGTVYQATPALLVP